MASIESYANFFTAINKLGESPAAPGFMFSISPVLGSLAGRSQSLEKWL